ncbi:MAG: glycosyltransferase family 4 protein [Chloroflexota bacterium]
MTKLAILADSIPWFGRHSGYEQIAYHLPSLLPETAVTWSKTTLNQIRLGKLYARLQGLAEREDTVYAAAEWRYRLKRWQTGPQLSHILYGEGHHHFLRQWEQVPPNIIATLHHPPEQWADWQSAMLKNIGRLSSAIVLYKRDLAQFEALVGKGRVCFIRHGVDADFFRPGDEAKAIPPRLLYVGQNGRNTDMLFRVVTQLSQQHPDLRFDFIVRSTIRQRYEGLRRLSNHPAIQWHEGLSDVALRTLYQQNTLLLLPMSVCGAANAIVEALACGLPIVTTDVGGMADYGGGTVYPLVANDDDRAMIALVERYLSDFQWRKEISVACRQFALDKLNWPQIAQAHLLAYQHLGAN